MTLPQSIDHQSKSHQHSQSDDPLGVFEKDTESEEQRIFEKAKTTFSRLLSLVLAQDIAIRPFFRINRVIAVCKKVRTGSKIEKELKVKKWEQLTQKI